MFRVWLPLAVFTALRYCALPGAAMATDCNHNGIEDELEISLGSLPDLNHNGVPDECEEWIDCNSNGLHDPLEVDYQDCNTNQIFDVCDVRHGAVDCNSNERPDSCEGFDQVRWFTSDAAGWRQAAGPVEQGVFDVPYPGRYEFRGALTGPIATFDIGDAHITISDQSGAAAVMDGAMNPAVSDAALFADQPSIWEFSPPISAFYSQFGSQAGPVTMRLYSGGCLIGTIVRAPLDHPFLARGFGFLSAAPIDRIEIVTPELAMMGAFVGLANGEPSLGRVLLPAYQVPTGAEVEVDFALVALASGGTGDANCDNTVNISDVAVFVGMLLDDTTGAGCGLARCDFDQNTRVDGADIGGFVLALMGG